MHQITNPILAVALAWAAASHGSAAPARDAETYAEAIDKLNVAHVRRPGGGSEDSLGEKLPRRARSALDRVLSAKVSAETSKALVRCGEAALDLALGDDFATLRERLVGIDPPAAAALGDARVRDRFVLRGFGELDAG